MYELPFQSKLKVVNKRSWVDPTDGQSKLIGKELDEDNISKLLAVFGTSPFLLFPLLENLVQLWQGSLIIDNLSILAGNIEWLCNEIWNILAHKHIWVKMTRINFLGKI